MQDLEPVTTSLTDTYLERVTPGVRFANFLIDMIVFCIIMFADAVFYLWIDWMAGDNDYIIESWGISIGDILFCLFVLITFIAYYTIMEAVWGRTIGKLTLGCKVVMNNGSRITAKQLC